MARVTAHVHNTDHPDVKIPPPLIYVGGYVVGWLLGRVLPVAVIPTGLGRAVALACLVVSAILAAWSIDLFRRSHTSLLPIRPATALIVSGPYRFTRNPMYLALTCLYLGLALWFMVFWALVLLPPIIGAVQHYVIRPEEHYLERRFGEEYHRYRVQVHRWI
jgi:protein-S-isoprenylcysteine O-methyltransferase Ste14